MWRHTPSAWRASPGPLQALSRFYHDHRRYGNALPYYDRGNSLVIKLGAEEEDPIALADVWREYATALESAGHGEDVDALIAALTAQR